MFIVNGAQRLQKLWDNVFGTHDPELYNHLNSNFVLPTTFGTKWTKVLFSRQFSEYILVWDAVIASDFTLVDFFIVAMVIESEYVEGQHSIKIYIFFNK